MKNVIQTKKIYSGSETFPLKNFLITKKIGVWLRDKIWHYCTYLAKENGKKWLEDTYSETPDKKWCDIEGMRASYIRAKHIKEGVNINISVIYCIIILSKR